MERSAIRDSRSAETAPDFASLHLGYGPTIKSPQPRRRRRPGRPFLLGGDALDARPSEAGPADADAVAQRLAVTLHQEQELVRGVDHDRARAFLAVILDHLLFVFRIERTLRGIDHLLLLPA